MDGGDKNFQVQVLWVLIHWKLIVVRQLKGVFSFAELSWFGAEGLEEG